MTTGSRRINIAAAAQRIYCKIAASNGGSIPKSMTGWFSLADRLGILVCPAYSSPCFQARLEYNLEWPGGWVIVYNGRANPKEASRFIAHEIAEYFAVADYPTLFDGLPNRAYHYSGANNTTDGRHRIAQKVERLCFRRKE